MRHLLVGLGLIALSAFPVSASEFGDRVREHLYSGTISEMADEIGSGCEAGTSEACFALGLAELVAAYERAAQTLYRFGATVPNSPTIALILGTGLEAPAAPANPDPDAITYNDLVALLDTFSGDLDKARAHFEAAGNGAAFVLPIDPLKVRIDLDGNGTAEPTETLSTILESAGDFAAIPTPDASPPGKRKTKTKAVPESTVGFDNADAIWLAGYATVASTPVEYILAHDFSAFFQTYFHRVFPKAGLPMSEHDQAGMLMMDPASDAFFADVIAALHTADFPVIDQPRLAGVRERLLEITALSRQNWELILAETDDDRELVPSPRQTSLVPDRTVTDDTVAAWLATLDTVDQVLNGELLLPHWRFRQGFDLKAYFDEATQTDFVMLFTGHDALPYLSDGPIADAESFAEANRVFGDDWPLFALWFN